MLIKFGPLSFIFEEVVRTTLEAFGSVPLDQRWLNASSVWPDAITFYTFKENRFGYVE